MEKSLKIFKNFQEAEEADRQYYLGLSPEERMVIAEKLRKEHEAIHFGSQQRFRRVFRIVKQA